MKEINIDVRKMTEAPIDNKNVMDDWLLDTLFDEYYTFKGNEAVGFIGERPTYAEYHENFVRIRYLKKPLDIVAYDSWAKTIVKRLTFDSYNNDEPISSLDITRLQFLDNSHSDYSSHLILTFIIYDDCVIVMFHWEIPKD